jgi:hypothetical protein
MTSWQRNSITVVVLVSRQDLMPVWRCPWLYQSVSDGTHSQPVATLLNGRLG